MPKATRKGDRTRRKILLAARRLWNEHGYDGVGIDAIMAEVGLTRGGFYAHFASKRALFAEAVGHTPLTDALARLEAEGRPRPDDLVERVVAGYLSPAHRDNAAKGCPLAALNQDIARLGAPATDTAADLIDRLADFLRRKGDGSEAAGRADALVAVALMVGGIAVARAAGPGALSDEVLAEARAETLARLNRSLD